QHARQTSAHGSTKYSGKPPRADIPKAGCGTPPQPRPAQNPPQRRAAPKSAFAAGLPTAPAETRQPRRSSPPARARAPTAPQECSWRDTSSAANARGAKAPRWADNKTRDHKQPASGAAPHDGGDADAFRGTPCKESK